MSTEVITKIGYSIDGSGISRLLRMLVGNLRTLGANEAERLNSLTTSEIVFHNDRLGIKQSSKVVWLNDVQIDSAINTLSLLTSYTPDLDTRADFKSVKLSSLKKIISEVLILNESIIHSDIFTNSNIIESPNRDFHSLSDNQTDFNISIIAPKIQLVDFKIGGISLLERSSISSNESNNYKITYSPLDPTQNVTINSTVIITIKY